MINPDQGNVTICVGSCRLVLRKRSHPAAKDCFAIGGLWPWQVYNICRRVHFASSIGGWLGLPVIPPDGARSGNGATAVPAQSQCTKTAGMSNACWNMAVVLTYCLLDGKIATAYI